MLLDIGASPGKVFIVHTDNTTTQDAIEQRKSRDPLVNKEWKAIQNLLLAAEIDIQARRVSSGENRADGLSRGHDGNHRTKDKMSTNRTLTPPDLRVLDGWKWSTLLGYNAAVKKFEVFKRSTGVTHYKLPITPEDVYSFVTWAGRGVGDEGTTKINATSLKNYLFAIKA
ncbi:hypothetical protein Pst134EB_023631 [Puccinia striiformis f. sp. tritici]|nr:hypothetical protein Pst134EB_023631 [Puccinia striiformis f. sp. tritici]